MTEPRPARSPVVPLASATAVLAHGAGSDSGFLSRAFPADRLGVAGCVYVDERSGTVAGVRRALVAGCPAAGPVVLGGVSLGAHAAAGLLAAPDRPRRVVAGLLVMPAWTGRPDRVADMTATAAAAVAALSPAGVLADLDPADWVTRELAAAWTLRGRDELAAELSAAAAEPAPAAAQLTGIGVPVAVVGMSGDPLHPDSVARQWTDVIPHSAFRLLGRRDPGRDLAVFADTARAALRDAAAAVSGAGRR